MAKNNNSINKQIMAAAKSQDSLLESNYPYLSVWEDIEKGDGRERYVVMEYVAGTGGSAVIRLAHSSGRSLLQTPQQMQSNLVNVETKLKKRAESIEQERSVVSRQNAEYDLIVSILLRRNVILSEKRWWHFFVEPRKMRLQREALAALEVKARDSELAKRILG